MPPALSTLRLLLLPLLCVGALACDSPELVALSCGDGRVDEPEECDEGEANGAPGACTASCTLPVLADVEGDVLAFMTEVQGERVAGATVSVLELPERSVVTGADAHFRFEGLPVGADLTLVVEHPDFMTTQTATITLGPNGVNPFSVQAVPKSIFTALSTLVPLPIELESHCVIATTAARFGGSLYVYLRQGAPGVAVSIEPSLPAESGPVYFDENVLPDLEQGATSQDGGVLFYRVPPGDYVVRGSREDMRFNEVRFQCRPGVIVNAGPPLGLLANVERPDHAGGVGRAVDAFSASTDALCAATAACVNEEAGATNYPDVTVASCRAMFANTWASVDEACDADFSLRDAAKAVFDCRATACDVTLGGDEACVSEEDAFTAAQVAYGACLISNLPD